MAFQLLCIIVPTQDDVAAFKEFSQSEAEQAPAASAAQSDGATEPLKPAVGQTSSPNVGQMEQQKMAPPPHQQQGGGDQRLKASPYAKKLAAEQGVDLSVKESIKWNK